VKMVGTVFATSISNDRPAAGRYETNNDELLDPETKLLNADFSTVQTHLISLKYRGSGRVGVELIWRALDDHLPVAFVSVQAIARVQGCRV